MHQILIGDSLTIDVELKAIKNLHLSVHPPHGRVRIAAPLSTNDETVRLFAISKLSWIRKHQRSFYKQERQSKREFVTGESHFFLGRRYLLRVIESDDASKVMLRHKKIELHVRVGSNREKREQVMLKWYRKRLKELLKPLIDKWETATGTKIEAWGVKLMKTKWGSCNIEARRIWLNLELAKKPLNCIEYVVVHELTHLLERHHNERFTAHLDRFLPQWRIHREELNRVPLGYAEWDERAGKQPQI